VRKYLRLNIFKICGRLVAIGEYVAGCPIRVHWWIEPMPPQALWEVDWGNTQIEIRYDDNTQTWATFQVNDFEGETDVSISSPGFYSLRLKAVAANNPSQPCYSKSNPRFKVINLSYTMYIDQPVRGSDDCSNYGEVGHTWWEFYCSDLSVLDPILQNYCNISVGFYPDDIIRPCIDHDASGDIYLPDVAHSCDVKYIRHICSLEKFKNGLSFVANMDNNPPDYELCDLNCTDMAYAVAASAGLTIPDSRNSFACCGINSRCPGTTGERLAEEDGGCYCE